MRNVKQSTKTTNMSQTLKLYALILCSLFSNLLNSQPFAKNITPISTSSVHFLDDNHGFMVGDRGKILETFNAGHTWDHKSTGIDNNFNQIKFFGENLGVIVGLDSMLLVTHNGGDSWETVSTGFGQFNNGGYTDVWLQDENTWFVTATGTFIKTTDAGATWTNSWPNTGFIKHIFFASPQVCYVGAGAYALMKSIDGGLTWNPLINMSLTGATNDMHFFDENTGIVVSQDGLIHRTTNGALSFEVVYTGTMVLNDLSFSDSQNGYCGGADGTVLKTTDGGQTWTSLPGSVSAYDITAVHASSTGGAEFYGEFGLRARTNGITVEHETEWIIEKKSLMAVAFSDENNGLVAGALENYVGIILRTNDGGNSWSRSTIPSLTYIGEIHFMTPSLVYAFGVNDQSTENVIVSTDSGRTFSSFLSPTPFGRWTGMANFGPDTLVFFGTHILSSYDAGVTWEMGDSYLGTSDFSMINPFSGYAAGGGVFFTDNAGDSYSFTPLDGSVADVYYAGPAALYVAVSDGTMYKSIDGGANYQVVRQPGLNEGLRQMEFTDANTGFIIGSHSEEGGLYMLPYLIYTSDGGASFQQIFTAYDFHFYSNEIFDLDMIGPSTGYAAGMSSNLFKICNSCDQQVVLGIEKKGQFNTSQINLYPNPAKDIVTLQLAEEIKTVRCINSIGQEISVVINNKTVETGHLSSGIYTLNITTASGKTYFARFVKY